MKKYLCLGLSLLLFSSCFSQIFSSNFENWSGNFPLGWIGNKTNLELDSIKKYTLSSHSGSFSCQLTNNEYSHRRFTTGAINIDSAAVYCLTYWVRGHGNIRTGLFDGRATGSGYATYNAYRAINSTVWTQYTDFITGANDTTGGEFVFSVQYTKQDIDNIQIDDVKIFKYNGAFVDCTDSVLNYDNSSNLCIFSWSSGGYTSGQNSYGMNEFAERYIISGTKNLIGTNIYVGKSEGVDSISLKVYEAGVTPGQVLYYEKLSIASINSFRYNYFTFKKPVTVTDTFYIGYEISYNHVTDTFFTITCDVNNVGATTSFSKNHNIWYNDQILYDMTISGYSWSRAMNAIYTNSPVINRNEIICEGDSVILSNGNAIKSQGIYLDTISGMPGCDSIIIINLTVNPKPVVPIVVTPLYYLVNDTPNALIAYGNDLHWYLTQTGGTGSSTPPVPSTATPGVFTFYVTQIINGCESNRAEIIVNIINPCLVSAPVATGATRCGSGTLQLTASNGNEYKWYSSISDSTPICIGSIFNTPILDSTKIYYVSNFDSCESTKVPVTATIVKIKADAGFDKSICSGEEVQIGGNPTASQGIGSYSYNWSPSTVLNLSNIPNPNAQPNATTVFTVLVTDSFGCQSTDTVKVTVKPLPNITISSSVTSINHGSSVNLNAGGGQSYSWWPSTGLNTTSGATVTASPLQNTIYHVIGTGANGCSSSDSIFIGVYCGKCPDTVMFATAGTFSSGCDDTRVYNDNSQCHWLIFPSGASVIYISFPEFDILTGDKIRIWQGPDTTTGVLKATYDNNNYSSGTISTTVPMFVELITNATDAGTGFKANYWTDINGSVNENSDFITNLKLFPNPADNVINIEFNTSESQMGIEIFDILGQKLFDKNLYSNNGKVNETINITQLRPGVYSFVIKFRNSYKYISFIVE
jgi:hypothetical protein